MCLQARKHSYIQLEYFQILWSQAELKIKTLVKRVPSLKALLRYSIIHFTTVFYVYKNAMEIINPNIQFGLANSLMRMDKRTVWSMHTSL